jgi:hypothetical protein
MLEFQLADPGNLMLPATLLQQETLLRDRAAYDLAGIRKVLSSDHACSGIMPLHSLAAVNLKSFWVGAPGAIFPRGSICFVLPRTTLPSRWNRASLYLRVQ